MSDTEATRNQAKRSRRLRRLMRVYPPFMGAGIVVEDLAPDFSAMRVRMRLHWWNRNYVGTHFGGSLYTMCDPFFVIILIERLGPGFIVWDKAATIRFRRPGRSTVRATFEVPAERVEEIRARALAGEIVEPTFTTQVLDEEGRVVAEVEKLLYVRVKD